MAAENEAGGDAAPMNARERRNARRKAEALGEVAPSASVVDGAADGAADGAGGASAADTSAPLNARERRKLRRKADALGEAPPAAAGQPEDASVSSKKRRRKSKPIPADLSPRQQAEERQRREKQRLMRLEALKMQPREYDGGEASDPPAREFASRTARVLACSHTPPRPGPPRAPLPQRRKARCSC